jgi:DNA-binding XRE family transcriptional regulator
MRWPGGNPGHYGGLRVNSYTEIGRAQAWMLMRTIRQKRLELGMSQAELGERCNLAQSQISEAERFVHAPSTAMMCAMATAVGLEVKLR